MLRWQEFLLIICLLFALIPFQQIAGESRGFAFVAFQTIDEARKWLELKKVVKSADRVFPMNDEPLKIHEHDDRSSRDRKTMFKYQL